LEEKNKNLEATSGRKDCAYKAIKDMIENMKNDIAQKANVPKDQIVVANIYNIVADTLAEACMKAFGKRLGNCICQSSGKNTSVSMDTFILMNTIFEDGMVTEGYKAKIFEQLIKMNPSLKNKVSF